MTLNNDTRISKGFVAALLDSRLPADAGIVGPAIDHGFPCAEAEEKLDAAKLRSPALLSSRTDGRRNGSHALPRMLADHRRTRPTHL
jgi:hypothetical protein